MNDIRILGEGLPERIENIEKKLNQYIVSPVSYKGGWIEFPQPLGYSSPLTIGVVDTTVDLRKSFSVGSLVRYKQGGDYQYAYITSVSANSIGVQPGSDYSLSIDVVTDMAIGATPTPTGHPVFLKFNGSVSALPGTYTNANPSANESFGFYMVGKLVFIRFIISLGTITGSTSSLFITPPTSINTTFLNTYSIIFTESTGTQTTGLAKTSSAGSIEIYRTEAFTGFPVQVAGVTVNGTLQYIAG